MGGFATPGETVGLMNIKRTSLGERDMLPGIGLATFEIIKNSVTLGP